MCCRRVFHTCSDVCFIQTKVATRPPGLYSRHHVSGHHPCFPLCIECRRRQDNEWLVMNADLTQCTMSHGQIRRSAGKEPASGPPSATHFSLLSPPASSSHFSRSCQSDWNASISLSNFCSTLHYFPSSLLHQVGRCILPLAMTAHLLLFVKTCVVSSWTEI